MVVCLKLIAGLGNPGKKYELTRHNVGFMVVEYLADKWNVDFTKYFKKGLVAEAYYQGEKVLLVKPQTYMNLSGYCIKDLLNFYKLSVNDIIVIYDDLDLSIGKLRIKPSGSSGGHKGMQSIMENIGTKDIIRVKVGIGRELCDAVNYVLGTFNDEQWEIMKKVIPKAVEATEKLLEEDIEKVMNLYNKDYSTI